MRSLQVIFHILVILMSICQVEFTLAQGTEPVPAPSPSSPPESAPSPGPALPSPVDPVPSPSFPPPSVPVPAPAPSPSIPPAVSPPRPPTGSQPCYHCSLPNTCSCSYYITSYVSCRQSELRSQISSSLNEINRQLRCLSGGGRLCSINNVCYSVRTVARTYSAARTSCINLRGFLVSTYTVSPSVAERCMDLEEDAQYWVSGPFNPVNCPAVTVNSDHTLSSETPECTTKLPYICQIWI